MGNEGTSANRKSKSVLKLKKDKTTKDYYINDDNDKISKRDKDINLGKTIIERENQNRWRDVQRHSRPKSNIHVNEYNIKIEENDMNNIIKETEKNNIRSSSLISRVNDNYNKNLEKNYEEVFMQELNNFSNKGSKDYDCNKDYDENKTQSKKEYSDNFCNYEFDYLNKKEQNPQSQIFDPNAMDDDEEQSTPNFNPIDSQSRIMQFNRQKYQNNTQFNNTTQFVSQQLYSKVDKNQLHSILICLKKCNAHYETAMTFKSQNNYIQSLADLSQAKKGYIKLYQNVEEKEANDEIPKEFSNIIKARIKAKMETTTQEILIVTPLTQKQKNSFRQGLSSQMNQLKQSQNFSLVPQKPQSTSPKKAMKSIHDIEDEKANAKIESEIISSKPDVKFSDIVGMNNLKQTIYEIIIMPTIRPDLFTGLRQPIRGLLLFGPPGTGKTMIAKAIAGECDSTFFNISASSLTSKWVGESEKTVRALFKLAYSRQPSIIFIDEIDSVLSKRSDSENEASKRLKTEFLIQFDGLGSNSTAKLLVIAATNRPMDLDDALKRRLPKRIYCGPLDRKGRADFIKKLVDSIEHTLTNSDFDYIARKTDFYSNSDLNELCREAAYEPVRELSDEEVLKIEKFRPITMKDFDKALRKIRGTISSTVIKEIEDWNTQFGAI